MDLRPLSDSGADERRLELCAACDHMRSQHKNELGQVCWSSVPVSEHDSYGRKPCP